MIDQALGILSTLAWIVLVAVILGLFGTTSGGAWSIAGSVAKGVTEWTGSRVRVRDAQAGPSSGPAAAAGPSTRASSCHPAGTHTAGAETEDLGTRPTKKRVI